MSDDIDDQYRRASALDASRPSEPVRRAVLAHAAQLAAERTAGLTAMRAAKSAAAGQNIATQAGAAQRRANQTWWRPAIIGTLAAAALAGLLITPQFLPTHSRSTAVLANNETSRSADAGSAPPAFAPAPAPAPAPALTRPQRLAEDKVSAGLASSTGNPAANLANPRATAIAPLAQASRATDPGEVLRRAAEIGDVDGVRALLGNPAIIDARDADGRTALMLATLRGRIQAVDTLLRSGADPNAADVGGMTPLQAAESGHQPEIAAALRRAGAR